MTTSARPRFTFTDGAGAVDFTLAHPSKPWVPGTVGVGDSDVSAAGVPAHFEVRRDATLQVSLRFPEAQWPVVRRMVVHGQRSGTIRYYPRSGEGDFFDVYLLSPAMGEQASPSPGASFGTWEFQVTFRHIVGTVIEPNYFGGGG
jgi:hypothetical protein